MTDRRALIFEVEEPSKRPPYVPTRPPWFESLIPRRFTAQRQYRRVEKAMTDWCLRVQAWEDAGRPPDRTRYYIPAAEVTVTELPDGTHEVSATALHHDAEILSVIYPSQENPS